MELTPEEKQILRIALIYLQQAIAGGYEDFTTELRCEEIKIKLS